MTPRRPQKWHKGPVTWFDGDAWNLSVVFTWDLPQALVDARFYAAAGHTVRIGGPAVHVRTPQRVELEDFCEVGGSVADAVVMHNPDATFASRGCPVGCWFCIVPSMEGRTFTLIDDFPVRPILCDNNLSALPDDYQEHVVRRYQDAGVPLLDANSGFEPATFTEAVYRRWKPIMRGPWRFAYDETGERDDVRRVMKMLAGEGSRRKRVYVLIGNEPFRMCMARILEVIAWGGEPHCQPVMKLNAAEKRPWVRFDWTEESLRNVARWANWRLWKYCDFKNYDSSVRTGRRAKPDLELFD